jgi:hypothetical protein
LGIPGTATNSRLQQVQLPFLSKHLFCLEHSASFFYAFESSMLLVLTLVFRTSVPSASPHLQRNHCRPRHSPVLPKFRSQSQVSPRNRQPQLSLIRLLTFYSVVDIACGGAHTLAVGRNGGLYVWGSNSSGQVTPNFSE